MLLSPSESSASFGFIMHREDGNDQETMDYDYALFRRRLNGCVSYKIEGQGISKKE